jgi:protoheme IX farnesyltransferase
MNAGASEMSIGSAPPLSSPTSVWTAFRERLADYFGMTKPRAMVMVCVTAAVGFVLADPQAYLGGSSGAGWWLPLLHLLVGTYLAGGGSVALNQCWEHRLDRLMNRTRNRPLASGRISPAEGWAFASAISVLGIAQLAWGVNLLTAALAAVTHLSYVLAYTPLKRRTPLCTLVGAIPGAIPPMMGWTAVRDSLDTPAWVLFAILFLWQMPHALAIAWIYRDDYAAAGFRVLSVGDTAGTHTRTKIAYYSLALLVVSLTPTLIGLTGAVYFWWALASGLVLLAAGLPVGNTPSPTPARRLLITASAYLVCLLCMMMFDRV